LVVVVIGQARLGDVDRAAEMVIRAPERAVDPVGIYLAIGLVLRAEVAPLDILGREHMAEDPARGARKERDPRAAVVVEPEEIARLAQERHFAQLVAERRRDTPGA